MKCLAWLSAVCRQRYCSYLELLPKICQLILRECMHAVTHCDTCIVHCCPLIIWIASDDCRALQSGDRGRAFGDGRFNWKQVLQGSASRVQSCLTNLEDIEDFTRFEWSQWSTFLLKSEYSKCIPLLERMQAQCLEFIQAHLAEVQATDAIGLA